ncbi:MAG TPA: SPFH domain-containing protein [Stellaceae bacterium]|nr:SPFH domain-containing protein [Stellaceae bacterium]
MLISGSLIVAGAFAFLGIVVVALSVRTVPQGYTYVVERLGRYHKTLLPGLNLIVPIVDSVRARVSMRETVLDIPEQSVITRDNAAVSADGVLFYQVLDPIKATYEVVSLPQAIQTLAMTTLRNVMGSMELDEILSKRETINAHLLQALDEATASWGTRAARIEIRDIRPPDDIVQAMARQLKAERDKRAQILEADANKESQIRIAQGKLEAAKLQAEARERLAQAEATATRLVSEAVASGSVQAINYFLGQKYVEALQAFAASPNQKVLILPTDLAGLAGTVSGVGEIVKEVFGGGGARTVAAPSAVRGTDGSATPAPGPWGSAG